MYKRFLFFVTLILASSLGFSQAEFGPRVALNLANNGRDASGDMRVAMAFGATADFKLNDLISLGGDLVYSMQGSTDETTIPFVGSVESTTKLNYINLPIYAKISPIPEVPFFILGGLQPGVAVTRKVKIDNTETNVKNSYKAFDLAVPLGVGVKLDMGLAFDARYNLGLLNISDIGNFKTNNSVFQIGVSYYIGM